MSRVEVEARKVAQGRASGAEKKFQGPIGGGWLGRCPHLGLDGAYSVELYIAPKLMAAVKQTAFRFTAEDLALLDAVQAHTGVHSRIDALRAVLRQYVRSEGVEVGAKTKRKPKR